jgi:hypothetical protein
MAVAFTITLVSPYILIHTTSSINQLIPSNSIPQWGIVDQINGGTTNCVVGDIICFNSTGIAFMQYQPTGDIYAIIDETKIFFTEAIL